MSVANVLRRIGDWTTSKDLVKTAAKELDITEKTVYEKLKKEVKEGAIRKIPLPDRGVIYGLPNWPLKQDDVKLLIDAINAISLSQLANARQLEALAKFIEATRSSKKADYT